jgi:hypothetical protein
MPAVCAEPVRLLLQERKRGGLSMDVVTGASGEPTRRASFDLSILGRCITPVTP